MDFIIKEVAGLPEPRPYLLLVGQQEAESSDVVALGKELLGIDGFQIRSVTQQEVADYYRVADAFTLASLSEGFGRVLLEAMSYGLPCLVHDHEVARYILDEHGYFADFKIPGSLSDLIHKVLAQSRCESKRRLRHHSIYARFGWEHLHSSYIDMIQYCAIT
jgi:glycosyltransferase involved in cell wall biosynthesis